ncbi:hypothetical protein VB711_26205 [Cronbergia sp. UHCC 0137]|uniref:hypothetical protein n=1 Tax=Cronbergia sp. UHCC 0137 TaxID=3110239 RepID=UPI002B1FE152|nr:hypothetical protein [Cronbergia sp. UHCC 0137]MEA5621302.1 hypothetical protein [Cronbergia sp. UHCC 0137]
MTVKKLIQAEIDRIPEQELDNLYQWIKEFTDKINNVKNGLFSSQNIPPETLETVEKHLSNSYHDLDYLAGTWTQEDETEFLLNTQQFNQIDPQLWQ